MKRTFTSLIVLVFVAIAAPASASAYYVNSGYQYTDYNAGKVNYYNHIYIQPRTYSYTYPVYYQTAPTKPQCNTNQYNSYGRYYESPEYRYQSNCNDQVEDYANRRGLPNQFLSEMSRASSQYYY